jgi:hypothetical protein
MMVKIKCPKNSIKGKVDSGLIGFTVVGIIIVLTQISSCNSGGCRNAAVLPSTEKTTDNQQPSAPVSSEQTDQPPVAAESSRGFALSQSILAGDKDTIVVLLNNGADPNSNDGIGGPKHLFMAARFHQTEIAKVLLDKGADVNCLYNGMTPLDIANKMGYDDLVALLTEHGGKPGTEIGSDEQSNGMTKTEKVVFTKDSNGYDWQRADLQTRQHFCETIATAESKEFNRDLTADFYYGALDSFYNSSDPNILNENIHHVVGLTTSAAIAGQ